MAVIDPAQRDTYRQYFDLKIDAIDLAEAGASACESGCCERD